MATAKKNELNNNQKKDWAKTLYLLNELDQKTIAQKVGTSPQSMTKWVKEGNWEDLRKSLLTSKADQLRTLYNLLDKIGKKLKDEDSIGDSKIADMYSKYTASIKNLETETSIAQVADVATRFHKWLQNIDPIYAAGVLAHFETWTKQLLKTF